MEDQERKIPYMTLLLIAINVIVYLYVERTGGSDDIEHMIQVGAMYDPLFKEGEYYRIITHFFLHFGGEHLFNNMISLAVLGYALEEFVGKINFLVLYFLSGILAGLASFVYNTMILLEPEIVSAGASGAVFGLMGALFALLLFRRSQNWQSELPRFLLYIGLSLFSGMKDPTIDNAAHVGGFVVGFLVCALMCCNKKFCERRMILS